jgi:hypothetical protein
MNAYVLKESPTIYYLAESFLEKGFGVTIYIDQYNFQNCAYTKLGAQVISFNRVEDIDSKAAATDKGQTKLYFVDFIPQRIRSYLSKIAKLKQYVFTIISFLAFFVRKIVFLFINLFPYKIKYWIFSFYDNFTSQTRTYSKFIRDLNLSDFQFLIVVEPEGLLVYYFAKLKVPFVYLSLELNNMSFEKKSPGEIYKKIIERKLLRKARFTIIQDESREKIFRVDNKIPQNHRFVYLPVSMKGNINKEKSDYFQKKFNIPFDKKIVLYAGAIMPWACLLEIVEQVKNWDEKFVFVIHGGRYDNDYLRVLKDKCFSLEQRVFISTEWVEYKDLDRVISSCDIGISSYIDNTLNNRLTMFASGKIAAYLKSGVPVIANNFEGLKEFYHKNKCGEVFDCFCEIGDCLLKINNEYSSYREHSFQTYMSYYYFDTNFMNIYSELKSNDLI